MTSAEKIAVGVISFETLTDKHIHGHRDDS